MTSLGNGNYNSRSMNGLTQIYANDITCDTISTIDANVANKLTVVGDVDIGTDLNVAGISNLSQTNATSLAVSGNTNISGNLTVVGITDTTRLQADNLILGTATYNAAVQLKMNGIMNIGDKVNDNNQSRTFNVRDTNGLISIGRYSSNQPGFELRNYDPVTSALRQDVLFLGPTGTSESWRWLFRSPGAGGDFAGGIGTRLLFTLNTPLYILPSNPANPITGTAYTARYSDTTTTNNLDFVLNPNASNFSSMVQAGDAVIVNSTSGKALTLTTNNATGCGIRMDTAISIGGNTTLTANSNLNMSGTGVITQTGTATNTLKAITLTANSNLTLSGTGIISQTGTGINTLTSASLTSTTASTNTTTGALIVTGGVGVGGGVNVGGTLTIHDTGAAKTSTISKSGNDLIIAGANNSSEFKVNNRSSIGSTATTFTSTFATTTINSVNGLVNSQGLLTHPDGTAQRSIHINNCLNDATWHSFISGKDIKQTTFSFLEGPLATVTIATGRHFFVAVQTIEGQEYNGVGILATTAGSWEVALYASGTTPARLALSNAVTTTADVMTYIDFQASYLELSTEIRYIAFRTTTSSPSQGIIGRNSTASRSNYGQNTMTNSKLDKRALSYANAGAFPDPIPTAQVMTNEAAVFYAVLY